MPMRVVRIDQFVDEPEEVDWLVDGLLADTGWTLFYAAPGTGKSTFALQLCDALREGKDFLGRSVKQCDFVYVQGDGASPEWREMCRRIAPKSVGKTIVDVPTYCFDNPVYVQYISDTIAHIKPGFVVYDSLYSMTASDINNPKILQAIALMRQCALGKPWLLIHHPTKSDPNNPAGSSALMAACSNDWALSKNRLAIRKGRLVRDKEVQLRQDENYLWHPYVREVAPRTTNTVQFRRSL